MPSDRIREVRQALLSAIEALQQAREVFYAALEADPDRAADQTVLDTAFAAEDAAAKALRKRRWND